MKVLIIGPAYPLRGGIADTNEAMCRSLNVAGHSATVMSFKMQYPNFLFPGKTQLAEGPAPAGIEVDSFIHSVNPLNWFQAARRINRMAPDLVVFRQWIPFMAPAFGTISRLLSPKIRKTVLVDNLYPHEKRPMDRLLTNYFIKNCHAHIALSSAVRDQLKEEGFKNILYTPHPVSDLPGGRVSKEEACEFLGLDAGEDYVLFFGLVRKYKGLDLLLDSFSEELMRERNTKLIIAGEFYDDPAYYERIIEKHSLSGKIIINNRFIPADEMKYYFSAAGLVAQTYHSATQSGITQLAYAYDMPMLVTNVGGLSEYVPHGKVGYIVEKDSGKIAASIVDFFENNRFEEFSRGVAEEKKKYEWPVFVERLIDLYDSI